MNRETQERWIEQVLDEVFLAAIASEPLRNALVFKGARILNRSTGHRSPAIPNAGWERGCKA